MGGIDDYLDKKLLKDTIFLSIISILSPFILKSLSIISSLHWFLMLVLIIVWLSIGYVTTSMCGDDTNFKRGFIYKISKVSVNGEESGFVLRRRLFWFPIYHWIRVDNDFNYIHESMKEFKEHKSKNKDKFKMKTLSKKEMLVEKL